MEAVERWAAALPVRPDAVASHRELLAAGATVMHPSEYVMELAGDYRDDNPISWVAAWDLLGRERVLIPQDAAVYQPKLHEQPCYQITTTNGLASGNSLEEAICHALCELVERDAMTLAEVVSSRLAQVLQKGAGVPECGPDVVDRLRGRHPHIRLETLPASSRRLVEQFAARGLLVTVVDITADTGVPSFFAACADDLGPNTAQGHGGFGTHPDAEVAVNRALTECAQGRAVDIQSMREDITLEGEAVLKYQEHVHRSAARDPHAWVWEPASRTVDFGDLPSHDHADIMDDVRFLLDAVRSVGGSRVLVVDLSPPGVPVSVVRVLVPGFESWGVDHCKIGPRATAAWNEALRWALTSTVRTRREELAG